VAEFKQGINIPLILTIGIVGLIILLVLIVGTEAWYDSMTQDEAIVKASGDFGNKPLQDLKDAQLTHISGYNWVDKKNNVITVPVEDAMTIMVQTQEQFPATQPSAQ
jgi:phosphopantetheinyl transferase